MAEPTSWRELHICRQAARGTAPALNAAGWVALPAIREGATLGAEKNRIIPREMTPSRNVARKSMRGTRLSRPTFQMGMYYDLGGILMTAFFGNAVFDDNVGGATGANSFVWKSGAAALPYYAIRMFDGLDWWMAIDNRCNELVLAGTGGNELPMITSNWIGGDATRLATPPTAVAFIDDVDYLQPADVPQPIAKINNILFADLMTVGFTITNNLAPRYTLQRSTSFRRTSLGSFGGTFDFVADYLTYGATTTVVATVTAGPNLTITPVSMAGIVEGAVIYARNVDGSGAEWVLVETLPSGGATLTGDFVSNKTANWLLDIYSFKRNFNEGSYPGQVEVEWSDTNILINTAGPATSPLARFEIENPLILTGPDEEEDESPVQHITGEMGYAATPASSLTVTLINEKAEAFYTTGY